VRKIIGIVLLLIGLVKLFSHGQPPAGTDQAYQTGYMVGQYTFDAMLIAAGLWLLLKKHANKGS